MGFVSQPKLRESGDRALFWWGDAYGWLRLGVGVRNRVSESNLGGDAGVIGETRFLARAWG